MASNPSDGSRPNPRWDPTVRKDLLPKITSIFDFNDQSLGQLRTWLEQNPPRIPASSVSGLTTIPAGTVVLNAASTVPSGWVLCNGTHYNASTNTTYVNLWSKIGVTFGGTGQADFAVPNIAAVVANVNYIIKL